jgi:hypothetical protein
MKRFGQVAHLIHMHLPTSLTTPSLRRAWRVASLLTLGALLVFVFVGCGEPILGEDHPGWKNPLCFDCHGKTTDYPHGSDRKEPGCRSCHGENGAPLKDHAADRQTCAGSGCHTSTGHQAAFSAPTDCAACHAP